MRLITRRSGLVVAALLLSALMLAVVPLVTHALSPMAGYITVLALYWTCYCLPVALIFGRGPTPVTLRLSMAKPWIPVTALALPVIIFVAANTLTTLGAGPGLLALAILCALINGPLEELAWRRPFRAHSDGKLSFELTGLALFTLWHVPLSLSHGITFDHGLLGLVGGALFLGTVWTVMTRAGNSVGWPMLSHALVNIVAFLPFFAMNFTA